MCIGERTLVFDLGEDTVLKLMKPVYGLSDSGNIRYKMLDSHNKESLKNISKN